MELTADDVERYVEEYRAEEPLYPVEQEGIETLPDALRAGEYGPRDAEWVVRWYFRRYLGEYPHDERAEIEDQFADVEMGRVKAAIADAADAIDDAVESETHTSESETHTSESETHTSESLSGRTGRSDDGSDAQPAHAAALDALTDLPAVDVRVGSAFLTFLHPDTYVPIGEREWEILRDVSSLDRSYPTSPSIEDYGRFLESVREIENRLETDARTTYMVLWRLSKEDGSTT
ncbi:hypothetical protein JCM18237_14390 [Halorubrum luteum]